ncbi:MAG: hypothetical protein WC488_03490 [Candidatus Micrarchaeia archaeon]
MSRLMVGNHAPTRAQTGKEKPLNEQMGDWRRAARCKIVAGNLPEQIVARNKWPERPGKDAEGKFRITTVPEKLGIRKLGLLEPGVVEVDFYSVREGRRAKRIVVTDLFRAVRMLKHVCDSAEAEFKKRDNILGEIENANARLAQNWKKLGESEYREIEGQVGKILDAISNDVAMSKKLGREKLEGAVKLLVEGKNEANLFNKHAKLAGACAKLVGFRNRYGRWRDWENSGVIGYNRLREWALRKERDEMVKARLRIISKEMKKDNYDKGFAIRNLWMRDCMFVGRIEDAVKVLRRGNGVDILAAERMRKLSEKLYLLGIHIKVKPHVERALAHLGQNQVKEALGGLEQARYGLSNDGSRNGKEMTKIVVRTVLMLTDRVGYAKKELEEVGKRLRDEKDSVPEGRAKNLLRSAYGHLLKGEKGAAILDMEKACEAFECNKPWWIAAQLEKTGDAYLDEAVGKIKFGCYKLMEKKDVWRSAEAFRKAAEAING